MQRVFSVARAPRVMDGIGVAREGVAPTCSLAATTGRQLVRRELQAPAWVLRLRGLCDAVPAAAVAHHARSGFV